MDFIIVLIVIGSIVASIGGFVIRILVIKRVAEAVITIIQQYEREQQGLVTLLNRTRGFNKSQITPDMTAEACNRLLNMRNFTNQMTGLQRQQYETKMSGMVSDVTSAGFPLDSSFLSSLYN